MPRHRTPDRSGLTYDVVIVGGGVIGSAVAFFLRSQDAGCRVLVVERDPTYATASSALSASSIRQQFSTPLNIAMSQFGLEFLRGEPTVGLHEGGYLYLASPAGLDILQSNHRVQRAAGADVALLEPALLAERFPWLDTADLAAGSFGLSGEGWFDGYGLLQTFRSRARALGTEFIADEVTGFERAGARIHAVRLAAGGSITAGMVVNAAGPGARLVAGMAGIALPVEARPRSVFVLDVPETLTGCPLIIDTTGVWLRPEGSRLICGLSPPEHRDPECFDLIVDHGQFEGEIWPALAHRIPSLERLRMVGSWAGHYEMCTWDHNALLGAHPDVSNLLFANGFSGHGMQHSPAAGRGIAELALHGAYRTLDLSELSVTRLTEGRRVIENCII